MPRIALLLVMALFQIHRAAVDGTSGGLIVKGDHNKLLYGHSFKNYSGLSMSKCLEYCLANCLCLSFQLCGDTNECQLCSSNKYLMPKALQESNGCTSFNFKDEDEVGNKQCDKSCARVINCCMTSSPCLHGGTCLPPLSSTSDKRFRCKCPDGYKGERCDDKPCEPGYTGEQCDHPMRSCQGYSNGSRIAAGNYTVLGSSNQPFKVYCDFDRNSSTTWTLIQSYSPARNRGFKKKPLFRNFHRKQRDPPSWSKYRLSNSRMKSIQQNTTKWRITCRNETDGGVYTEYIRALNSGLNVLSYNGNECMKVENINIGGHSCTNCKVFLEQNNNTLLHFSLKQDCTETFTNRKIEPSCTLRNQAIQIWFGGE